MTGKGSTPRPAITAVSNGTAQLMRDYTIPFAADLHAAAEEARWATELPILRIGNRDVDITQMPRTAVAGLGHDLTVGVLTVVAIELRNGVVSGVTGDLYEQLLKKPTANLWRRLRDKPRPEGSQIRVTSEIWFPADQILLMIEIVSLAGETDADFKVRYTAAAQAAEEFFHESVLPSIDSPDPQGADHDGNVDDRPAGVTHVVHVKVEHDGTMAGPAFTAPQWWMLPHADGPFPTPGRQEPRPPTPADTGEPDE